MKDIPIFSKTNQTLKVRMESHLLSNPKIKEKLDALLAEKGLSGEYSTPRIPTIFDTLSLA
jgi:hypothetical protein